MAEGEAPLVISDLSGGRNGVDAPTSDLFSMNQTVFTQNMDYRNGGLGRRRGGSVSLIGTITGSGLGANLVGSLFRHDPNNDVSQWEMHFWDAGNVFSRLPVGTACANPTVAAGLNFAAVTGNEYLNLRAVSFNGKMFLFYSESNAQNRIIVLDPTTNAYRYVGASPGTVAPTVADGGGGGGYTAVLRWYRVRWTQLNGSVVVRRSEPTPSVTFTPDGAHANATITRPALPAFDSGYTHWELEASPDNVFFYGLYAIDSLFSSPIAIATTTAVDNTTPAGYTAEPLSNPIGTYTLIPHAKYGITDGNRLILFNLSVSGLGSRVIWTNVLGSLDRGDDERVFQTATIKPYLDLNTKSGGDGTGIAQIEGVIYCFKAKEIWRLTPTTSLEAPYTARRISHTVGCSDARSIAAGEDSAGNACIYFMSHKGPYRVGPNGTEYLGRDIEDVTRTLSGAPNLNTNAAVMSHSVYHSDLSQWWLWFSVNYPGQLAQPDNTPSRLFILDVRRATRRDTFGVRGGWVEFTGLLAQAINSTMGPAFDAGALTATVHYRPWISFNSNGHVGPADLDTETKDNGTAFIGQFKTRSVYKYGQQIKIGELTALIRHGINGGVSLTATVDHDFGMGAQNPSTVVSNATEDVYLPIKFDAAFGADATAIQIGIAESAAQAGYWEMVELKVPVYIEGDL